MTDFAADTPLSTAIDTGSGPSAGGGGAPSTLETEARDPSVRDDLEAVIKNEERRASDAAKKAEAKDDAKPAKEAAEKPAEAKADEKAPEVANKPEDPTEGAHKAETEEQAAKREEKERADRRHVEAPSKFLPRAKELWRNTPREVQQEVERITREHEGEVTTLREATQRYEGIREFDELAKTNGRDLRDSLLKMNQIENTLKSNPIAGLNQILMEIGPRKADGQPVSLFEVAAHIVQQGPQGYQQIVAQAQQRQEPAENPEVARLKAENAQLQQQHITATIIEPFARENPRYFELQPQIASFLKSDMIPISLSPIQRLEAAYDMAERISPSSHAPASADKGLEPEASRRADNDFSGSKSIKSAPGSVSDDAGTVAKGDESRRDSILAEMRRLNRA